MIGLNKKSFSATLLALTIPFCAMASHSTNGLEGLKYVMMILLGIATLGLINFILCIVNLGRRGRGMWVFTIIMTIMQAIISFYMLSWRGIGYMGFLITFAEVLMIAASFPKTEPTSDIQE